MRVVIVTHGRLAEGFASAVEVLLGAKGAASVVPVCVGETGEDVGAGIASALDSCAGETTVIVTDALAGSTTQAAAPVALERGIPLVTGANLGLVVELVMAESFDPAVVEEAREQVALVG